MTIDTTKPILVAGLDLETTGLVQTEGHRIIEIYISLTDLRTGKLEDELHMKIHPQRGIDDAAFGVHGITLEMLTGCPYWEEVAQKVHAFMSRALFVVAHNGEEFDMPFLYGEFIRVGLPLPKLPLIDTMKTARWATPDGTVPNLGALAFACGVPYNKDDAHAADYDVKIMMACFLKYFSKGFFGKPSTPYMFVPMKSKPKRTSK